MIKELRVGNIYMDVCGVKNTWKASSFEHYRSVGCPISKLKPIPLTDEWKTKLSFKPFPYEPENLNEGYYWSLQVIKGIYLTIEDGDDYAYLDYGLDFNGTKNLIKYEFIHEIQNVYHSLKKEDITIK